MATSSSAKPVLWTTSEDRLTRRVRLGLGVLFLLAGLAKLFAQRETAALLESHALPFPSVLAFVVGSFEALGGLMLLTDTRAGAFSRALILFVATAALLMHEPFGLAPGLAYANAVSLMVDLLVLVGLGFVARRAPAR